MRWARFALLSAALSLASCGGNQSAVDAAGIQAERLESLWWLFLYITAAVYVIVMIVLGVAVARRRRATAASVPETSPDIKRDNRAATIVKVAVALSVVTLFALMVTSFRTGKAIASLADEKPEIAIKITGHQWWWEMEYQDEGNPSHNVLTANELHVPVGRAIKVLLQSTDVIHSLWMPNLHGKKDLVPLYPTTFYFEASRPGTYWGQCAEFCGYQHAKMRFMVVAESPEDFSKWLSAQQQTPPQPTDALEKRGLSIFATSVCAQCHTIQGTGTNGRVGPNLTHIASRPYIAAGSLQNTDQNLAEWIADPQHIKPGIKMPMNFYSDEDMRALVAYLKSLK
ncbi:MAG: cytochrome c oxidase subunit II [Acidobacteria bacterium]|nr:cytochrome c oxidase subunit II [Acidobacteriota bacterium]